MFNFINYTLVFYIFLVFIRVIEPLKMSVTCSLHAVRGDNRLLYRAATEIIGFEMKWFHVCVYQVLKKMISQGG